MKYKTFALILGITTLGSSCSFLREKSPQTQQPNTVSSTNQKSGAVQTENRNSEALQRANALTENWPEASFWAAKSMIEKYGEPNETTSDSLIWRNVAPFKKIVVHREVYSSKFPLLHQSALEHFVDYKAPTAKVVDVWRFDGAVNLDRARGQMSATSQNEPMNFLALNLAHDIMTGKMSAASARIKFGKETMEYLNGHQTVYTQTLNFGSQINTIDPDESITSKISWGSGRSPAESKAHKVKQAQEARQK
jgi:hypothetical protein